MSGVLMGCILRNVEVGDVCKLWAALGTALALYAAPAPKAISLQNRVLSQCPGACARHARLGLLSGAASQQRIRSITRLQTDSYAIPEMNGTRTRSLCFLRPCA